MEEIKYWEDFVCPVHGTYKKDWTVDNPGPNGICWTVIKCSIECPRGKDCIYCGHQYGGTENGWDTI